MRAAPLRVALVGYGRVGGSFVQHLREQTDYLYRRYGVCFALTGVLDVAGFSVNSSGLVPTSEWIESTWTTGYLSIEEFLSLSQADVLIDATTLDLEPSGSAIERISRALQSGVHVITSNKGPIATGYSKLSELAAIDRTNSRGTALRFSACVVGALPLVTVGSRDLEASPITRIQGVLNGTSHLVLTGMRSGDSRETALARAQAQGMAEEDPSHDLSGRDAAAKLVILANALLEFPATLSDVTVTGLDGVLPSCDEDCLVMPIATAEVEDKNVSLRVGPECIGRDHSLAALGPNDMGAVISTADGTELTLISNEPGAATAGAAILRDLLDISRWAYECA